MIMPTIDIRKEIYLCACLLVMKALRAKAILMLRPTLRSSAAAQQ